MRGLGLLIYASLLVWAQSLTSLAGCAIPQPERKRGVPRILLGAEDEADDDDVDDEDALDDDDDVEEEGLLRAAPILDQGLDLDAIIAATDGAARPGVPGQQAARLAQRSHVLTGNEQLVFVEGGTGRTWVVTDGNGKGRKSASVWPCNPNTWAG